MKLTEQQEQLLRQYARLYGGGGYGLEDKVDEGKLEELTNLLRDPEVEVMFNNMIVECKPKKRKKKEL